MGIKIPPAPPAKKVETQSPPPDSHFGGWWIVSILGFVMLMAVVCFFLPACNLFFTKTLTGTESPPTEDAHRKLANALCERFTWCDNAERKVEQALRDFESDSDKINAVNDDIDNTWSFLLGFVDDSQSNPNAFLGELADFDKSNFEQIIAQQKKLRQAFESFQDVTQVSFDTKLDSAEYPVLSFVDKVKRAFPVSEILQEENQLPFFINNDVNRAKFLKSVIESGRDNNLIKGGRDVKVFEALCQLTDEKTVEALYDQEKQIKKLCIVPDEEYPTQRQCERLKTEAQKKQAKAFLDLRDQLKTHLKCDT
jgi:hypothetical protein